MSNSSKALVAVLALIILVGGTISFVGSGTNGGSVPTPAPTPRVSMQPTTTLQMVSPSASPAMSPAAVNGNGSPVVSPSPVSSATVPAGGKEVKITVHGGGFYYKPDMIKVKKGDKVVITYINDGGMHDFNIDELNVHSRKINTGETDAVMFVADKAGTFEYYCSVGQHRQMGQKGKITVE